MPQKRPQICYFFAPKYAIVNKDVTFPRRDPVWPCQNVTLFESRSNLSSYFATSCTLRASGIRIASFAGDFPETISPIQLENTSRRRQSSAPRVYYWPLYQSARQEGSTIVVFELNVPNFSYSCPKLSLVSSVSVIHVQVMQHYWSGTPACSQWGSSLQIKLN